MKILTLEKAKEYKKFELARRSEWYISELYDDKTLILAALDVYTDAKKKDIKDHAQAATDEYNSKIDLVNAALTIEAVQAIEFSI